MAKRYSQKEQRAAVARLLAEPGLSVRQLAAEMGVSVSTLHRWRQSYAPTPTPDESDAPLSSSQMIALLRERLIKSAVTLASSLDEVVDNAPLNQRATALSQLIDKIIKLAEQLPVEHEQVIRIEYLHPDGSIRQRPPWAEDDSTE